MSYWYGKVAKIYLKEQGDTHWYYRRMDLEDNGVDLAQYMGKYELVLSDHISLVDMTCVEDHALIVSYDEGNMSQHQLPPETPYHCWNVEIKFVKSRTKVHLHVDQEFCQSLYHQSHDLSLLRLKMACQMSSDSKDHPWIACIIRITRRIKPQCQLLKSKQHRTGYLWASLSKVDLRTDKDNKHFKRVQAVLAPFPAFHRPTKLFVDLTKNAKNESKASSQPSNAKEGQGKGGKGKGKKKHHDMINTDMIEEKFDPIAIDINR
ncbi:hypothetical protein DFH29DRAFT_881866 [Suillus ampliporus]|nr:hypothetical protein DFH29DRAFT_881866 [Suillus ampliporus]